MKYHWFIFIVLFFNGQIVIAAPATTFNKDEQITEAETQEAHRVARAFTIRFLETQDLTSIVKDLYLNDFIDRHRKLELERLAKDHSGPVDLLFLPGLEYNSRLLSEAGSEDWQRFYIAANSFVLCGLVPLLSKAASGADDFEPDSIYPPQVVKLLNTNPNLANMIVKKGRYQAIRTIEEMRSATATLEQAVAIMREERARRPIKDREKLEKKIEDLIKSKDYFKPRVEVVPQGGYSGLAAGARIILINTPLFYMLMLVKGDNGLRVLWAEPNLSD